MAARTSSWLAPAPPTVAIEIASRRVTAVSVEHSAAGPVVAGQATEILPEGAVVPALASGNIRIPEAVIEARPGARPRGAPLGTAGSARHPGQRRARVAPDVR